MDYESKYRKYKTKYLEARVGAGALIAKPPGLAPPGANPSATKPSFHKRHGMIPSSDKPSMDRRITTVEREHAKLVSLFSELQNNVRVTINEASCCEGDLHNMRYRVYLNWDEQKYVDTLLRYFRRMEIRMLAYKSRIMNIDNKTIRDPEQFYFDHYHRVIESMIEAYHIAARDASNELIRNHAKHYSLVFQRMDQCSPGSTKSTCCSTDCCDSFIRSDCFTIFATQKMIRLKMIIETIAKNINSQRVRTALQDLDKLILDTQRFGIFSTVYHPNMPNKIVVVRNNNIRPYIFRQLDNKLVDNNGKPLGAHKYAQGHLSEKLGIVRSKVGGDITEPQTDLE